MHPQFNFCPSCGSKNLLNKIPHGDNVMRQVCGDCNEIHYFNPKIIVGTLPIWKPDGRVLICKRAIEPRLGYWTLPCGFMENGESTEAGAKRETLEEANANVQIESIHTIFSLPQINQVYLIYAAYLEDLSFSAGEESEEVKLVDVESIDMKQIAFTSVAFALKSYLKHKVFDGKVFLGTYSVD